jgi:hypothetical protein
MISKEIYFVDGWIRSNIGTQLYVLDAQSLARRCIADAAKAGFTHEQLEKQLGTDLIDFFTGELKAREAARTRRQIQTGAGL